MHEDDQRGTQHITSSQQMSEVVSFIRSHLLGSAVILEMTPSALGATRHQSPGGMRAKGRGRPGGELVNNRRQPAELNLTLMGTSELWAARTTASGAKETHLASEAWVQIPAQTDALHKAKNSSKFLRCSEPQFPPVSLSLMSAQLTGFLIRLDHHL